MNLVEQFGAYKYVNKNFAYGDTEALFKKNLKIMPSDWLWRTKSLQYTVNSQFYRAPEWDQINWSNSYVLFGCSLVFGLGIDDSETCSTQLSKLLGNPVINLGMPGSSPFVCWVNSTKLRTQGVNPKGVIYLWPNVSRTSRFVDDDAVLNYGLAWNEDYIFRDWANDMFHCTQYTKNLLNNVELIWKCPIYHFHHFPEICKILSRLEFLDMPFSFKQDHARDVVKNNAHPGPKTNEYWAQRIYNKITDMPG